MKRVIALSLTVMLVLSAAACLSLGRKDTVLRFMAEGARIVTALEVFEVISAETAGEWRDYLADHEQAIQDLPEDLEDIKAHVKERLAQWLDELHAEGKLPEPEYNYLVARLTRW